MSIVNKEANKLLAEKKLGIKFSRNKHKIMLMLLKGKYGKL